MTRLNLRAAALLACVAIAPDPGTAGSATESPLIRHRTVFNVRFGVLPVGTATLDFAFNDERYEFDVKGKTVGIAELIAPGKGTAESAGTIEGNRIVAARADTDFVENEKKSSVHMEFANGDVTKVDILPPRKRKRTGSRFVAIDESHLRSVIDPASAIVVPVAPDLVNDPKAVCNRTLNLYDGETRYDIALEFKSTQPVSTKGYEGDAYVCSMRYVPVAGHRKRQKNIEYMKRNTGMEIWLAPMEGTNLFSPIRIEVPTWVGRVSAVPSYFGSADD